MFHMHPWSSYRSRCSWASKFGFLPVFLLPHNLSTLHSGFAACAAEPSVILRRFVCSAPAIVWLELIHLVRACVCRSICCLTVNQCCVFETSMPLLPLGIYLRMLELPKLCFLVVAKLPIALSVRQTIGGWAAAVRVWDSRFMLLANAAVELMQ